MDEIWEDYKKKTFHFLERGKLWVYELQTSELVIAPGQNSRRDH